MRISVARRNAQLDSLTASLNNGYLRTFDGPRPASISDALTGANHQLSEHRYAAAAYAPSANGVATANAIAADASADAAGVPTFARSYESNGTTVVIDQTAGCEFPTMPDPVPEILVHASGIVQGGAVNISANTITQPDGA